MAYDKGCHTVFYHRYHIVWATKYRYDVLRGELRLRVREIIRQVCAELGVTIVKGVLSRDSGNITDDVILQYLDQHIQPTGLSR